MDIKCHLCGEPLNKGDDATYIPDIGLCCLLCSIGSEDAILVIINHDGSL